MDKWNGFIQGWLGHRNALIELLGTLEEGQQDFKAWEQGMSVSELTAHIAGSMEMFVQTVKKGEFTPPPEYPAIETLEQLKALVQEETSKTKAALEELTQDQLGKTVDFYGMTMPGIVLLENAKDHEIHHKGQLFTYARLAGIEKLPFFVSR
ncbi:DinB family protein [Bacillus infantis]|uniref:Damage-inducible protein DinB n=1 Tax=Bacillus infantis TaxID=324767 RepID=A0A5D4R770_9BACI|nr:DinB family protein [Bacillus infantis]TYS45854.1 damage-inducible protein DinB [Bacillus infantis]